MEERILKLEDKIETMQSDLSEVAHAIDKLADAVRSLTDTQNKQTSLESMVISLNSKFESHIEAEERLQQSVTHSVKELEKAVNALNSSLGIFKYENSEKISNKLEPIYTRIRENEHSFEAFKQLAAKEHAHIIDRAKKETKDDITKTANIVRIVSTTLIGIIITMSWRMFTDIQTKVNSHIHDYQTHIVSDAKTMAHVTKQIENLESKHELK